MVNEVASSIDDLDDLARQVPFYPLASASFLSKKGVESGGEQPHSSAPLRGSTRRSFMDADPRPAEPANHLRHLTYMVDPQ
jgi:hypothetical protein